MTPLLDTIGRFHPMVLHLPIGLLLGLAAWELWRGATARKGRAAAIGSAGVFIAWLAVAGAAAAIGTGLLHERELGAGDPTTTLHKWLGIAAGGASLLTAILASAVAAGGPAKARRSITAAYRAVLFATIALLLPAGHLGGTITHGEGYLLEPLLRATRSASADPPPGDPAAGTPPGGGGAPRAGGHDLGALQDAAFEVLASRCESCHGPARTRGGLRVTSLDELLAGGRDGAAITPGDPGASHIVQRMRLPIDDRDHMPPPNRPQPTQEEIASIEAWIRALGSAPSGAAPQSPSPPIEDAPSRNIPSTPTPPEAPREAPLPPPADPAALAAVRAALHHAQPLAADSTLLWIDLSGPEVDDARAVALLTPLTAQAADLSLARSRTTDALAGLLASMPNLERLDLSGTPIGDDGLAPLAGHPRLRTLVLAGTRVTDAAADILATMPALRRVYLWNTQVTAVGLAWLSVVSPDVAVDLGQAGDPPLEAEPEVVVGAPAVPPAAPAQPINDRCPVTGSPVDARYTIIHEGRTIGFCCPNCPAAFQADPARYAGNLPRPD